MRSSNQEFSSYRQRRIGAGFTVVELLVSLAVVSVLLSLLLPAVQNARATARRSMCMNNLRQQGIGFSNFASTFGYFPGSGWGYSWLGMSDRGFGDKQPGGWMFALLPFVEQKSVYELAPRSAGGVVDVTNVDRLVLSPVVVYSCPERRSPIPRPSESEVSFFGSRRLRECIRSDYCGSGGTIGYEDFAGPNSLLESDAGLFSWPSTAKCNGVVFLRSQIRFADITDGASNVVITGEKWVSSPDAVQIRGGDNQPFTSGDCADVRRWGWRPPSRDGSSEGDDNAFGSAHNGGAGFAFCDGSVRFIGFSIDPYVFQSICSRNDGNLLSE